MAHPSARPPSRESRRNLRNGLLFASPWIVNLVVFIAYPIAASLYYSLCNYDALRPPRWVGLENYAITSTQKITPGKHTIKFDFAYDGGRGGGGTGTLSIDGTKVGEGRIAKTNSNTFGIDESADVGTDENTPVVLSYKGKERCTGKIGSITIETLPAKKSARFIALARRREPAVSTATRSLTVARRRLCTAASAPATASPCRSAWAGS
jgi:ABC-type sugar transport system permease subunit